MDFRFDDEQLALRDAITTLCQRHFDLATVAAREGTAPDAPTWRALAEMGVFGMLLPADQGGYGRGAVDAAIVFEQFGAQLASGPRLWSTIAAAQVLGAANGDVRVAGVVAGAEEGPFVVDDARESDVVVVVHPDRVESCDASALPEPVPGSPFDPLTQTAAYAHLPTGTVVGGFDEAERLHRLGTMLTAAELVGVAQGALDVASRYALDRRQFGVQIGSFQAIKHLLADMYVRLELARSATYAAAAVFDDARAGDAATAASTAKLLAGDAGIANGRTAVQVLGGMGFTWDMLPNYFLKRAWVLEHAFGTADHHALVLSSALPAR